MSWSLSRDSSQSLGGYLVSILSQSENDFVQGLLTSTPYNGTWIGGFELNGAEGLWRWASGEPWGYTNWNLGTGEPNNGLGNAEEDAIAMFGQGSGYPTGKWNDAQTTNLDPTYIFVVEYDTDPSAPGGPKRFFSGSGHWYQVVRPVQAMSWTMSRDAAIARGGYLVSVTSQGENDFVKSLLPRFPWGNAAIGGYEKNGEGNWQWVNDDGWGYTNWNSGEPNNGYGQPPYEDVVVMLADAYSYPPGTWNDAPKDNIDPTMCFVVEYESDPGTTSEFCFETQVPYSTGATAQSVFAADLDGDGDRDLVVANSSSDNVSVLKNNGNGTFGTAANYPAGDGPTSVFISDLDSDGDADMAVTDYYNDNANISILKNNGDGTLAALVSYSAGHAPVSVFAADLDGDGDSDLAVANFNNISVLKNNGSGVFTAAVDYPVNGGPVSVYATDLDADGDADLATANNPSDNVSVLKNNGNGTFAAAVNYPAGDGPVSVFAVDLDTDGDADLATANLNGDNVSVLKNNGNGTFVAGVYYPAGDGPSSVVATDMDADGDDDLAIVNNPGDDVSVLRNNGNGTFAAVVNYPVGVDPYSVFAADLDGDGDQDLVTANGIAGSVSVLINCLTPTIPPTGCSGYALQFDGANDEVDIPHDASLSFGAGDPMTVELWFKQSGLRFPYHLIGKRVACGDNNYQLAYGAGELHFSTGSSPAFRVGTPFSAAVGEWVHVAATYGGGTVRLYVNGLLRASGPGSLGNANTEPLRIGQSGTCEDGQRFIGTIDEVRVWNVARTSAEIATNFTHTIDPLTPGLVGYYRFDEAPTDQVISDLSPLGNNGTRGTTLLTEGNDPVTVVSNAFDDCEPPSEKAISLDGSSVVSVADAPSLDMIAGSPKTVELWFNPAVTGGTYHLIGKRSTCPVLPNYQIAVSVGQVFWGSANNTSYTFTPPQGEWTHVAGVYDGTRFTLYVNGQPQSTAIGSPQPANNAALLIGGSADCSKFPGLIDEVRIWDVARTPQQICGDYHRTVDPGSSGLVGYWRFDESTGSPLAVDLSSHGNNGTLNGATRVLSTVDLSGAIEPSACVTCSDPAIFCLKDASPISVGVRPSHVISADLDADGFPDLAVANDGNSISIARNDRSGGFTLPYTIPTTGQPDGIAALDFDNDGDLDLAYTQFGSGKVAFIKNEGYDFTLAGDMGIGSQPRGLSSRDLTGDNKADLAVANYGTGTVAVLKGNGDGSFSFLATLTGLNGPFTVACADIDEDGDQDLVVPNHLGGSVFTYKNNGTGSFAFPVMLTTGAGPVDAVVEDLDGDTHVDIAVANFYGNSVTIYKGSGAGSFIFAGEFDAGSEPSSVAAATIDADVRPDLIFANRAVDSVTILTNCGNLSFTEPGQKGGLHFPQNAAVADFDKNGASDLAVSSFNSDQVSVLTNCRLPILSLVSVKGPKNIIEGHEYELVCRISNSGAAPATNFTVAAWLSSDPNLDLSSDLVVSEGTNTFPILPAGATDDFTVKVLIQATPSGFPESGEKYHWIAATSRSVAASDERVVYRNRTPVVIIPGILGTYIFDNRESGPRCGDDRLVWINCVRNDQWYLDRLSFVDGGTSPRIPEIGIGRWLSHWPPDYNLEERGIVFNEGCHDISRFDVYMGLINDLIDESKGEAFERDVTLFVFPYDWRYDNAVAADSLTSLVNSITEEKDAVDIICHSMGSFVARGFSAHYPVSTKKIGRLFYLAAPLYGALEMLLINRWGIAQSYRPCTYWKPRTTRELCRNWISTYELFPTSEYHDYISNLELPWTLLAYTEKRGGVLGRGVWEWKLEAEIHDVADARELFNPSREPLFEAADNFLSAPPFPSPLGAAQTVYAVVGYGEPTYQVALVRNDEPLNTDSDELVDIFPEYTSGDGRVPVFSGRGNVPEDHVWYVAEKHIDVPGNDRVIKFVRWKLLGGAQPSAEDALLEELPSEFEYQRITTSGPARLIVSNIAVGQVGADHASDSADEIDGIRHDIFPRNDVIVLTQLGRYRIDVHGTDSGLASISIAGFDSGSPTTSSSFLDFPVIPGSRGTFTIDQGIVDGGFEFDLNGDSVFESLVNPTTGTPLYGNIIDSATGNPVEGVTLQIYSEDSVVFQWISGDSGGYSVHLPGTKDYVAFLEPPTGLSMINPSPTRVSVINGVASRADFVVSLYKQVEVDILPGVCPNTLLLNSPFRGNLIAPAAASRPEIRIGVVGSRDFDVSSVSPSELRLAGIAPFRYRIEDVTRQAPPLESDCACTGAGGDGIPDLVLYFRRDEVVTATGGSLDTSMRKVKLTGTLLDGTPIHGSDCLTVHIIEPKNDSLIAEPVEHQTPALIGTTPNPFNASTEISFSIGQQQRVELEVFNVLGQSVRKLVNEELPSGIHNVVWDGTDDRGRTVASGVYLYRLVTPEIVQTKQMVLLK